LILTIGFCFSFSFGFTKQLLLHEAHASAKTAGVLRLAAKRALCSRSGLASRAFVASASSETAATRGRNAFAINGKGAFGRHL